jgi:hypothetical protein
MGKLSRLEVVELKCVLVFGGHHAHGHGTSGGAVEMRSHVLLIAQHLNYLQPDS